MKKAYKIIWIICLSLIVIVSLIISIKLYYKLGGFGTLLLFGDAVKIVIYEKMEIYTIIQAIDFLIIIYTNLIGHFVEWYRGKEQNIHFYGITNMILCFTICLIDVIKYDFEYRFACPELIDKIFPITVFIIFITIVNCIWYMLMVIRKRKKKKEKAK